jgi:nucleolin
MTEAAVDQEPRGDGVSGEGEDLPMKKEDPGPPEKDRKGEEERTEKKKRRRKRRRRQQRGEPGQDGTSETEAAAAATTAREPAAADGKEEDAARGRESELRRTVYVEGLPFDSSEAALDRFWGEHADVTDVLESRLPVWRDSGRLRGYGHVVFGSERSVEKVLKLSGNRDCRLQGRYLTVQRAKPPNNQQQQQRRRHPTTQSEPSATLALHNLSYAATEGDVEAALKKYGEIAEGGVRVVRHSATGQSKGFGYVKFADLESAAKAFGSTVTIAGRTCRVDYDHGRVRGSFRTADRKLWHKEYGRDRKRARRTDEDEA